MSTQGWPAMGGPATVLSPIGGNGTTMQTAPGVMVPGAMQQAQPTGQLVVPPGNQVSYGIGNLPPAPQPAGFQGQVPIGPQGQYGLPGAYGQPQGFAGPQGPMQYYQQQAPMQQAPMQQFSREGNGVPGPGYVQQPQGWPQQPTTQPQMQQPGVTSPQQLNAQTRLDGPNVPPELRGRTIGEVMSLYNSMATMAQGYGRPPQGQQPIGPQQPLLPSQPQQPPAGSGGMAAPGSFWQNPEPRFEALMERIIEQRLGPVVQFTQTQALTGARMAAQQQVPDFAQLEAEVQQLVANAQPEALANPNTWIGAADIVRGRQMREGRYQSSAPTMPGQQLSQPSGFPSSTQLPPGAFFTEAPSAPAPTGMGGAPVQPSAQDVAAAQKFNMPIGDWMGWKYGVQPATVPNPGSTFVGQQQPIAPWHYGPFAGGVR